MQLFNKLLSPRSLAIFSTISFLLLTLGILIAWNTPVTGYEPSIYSATPFIYWFSLIFGFAISFLLIIGSMCGKVFPRYFQVIKWLLLGVCMSSFTCLFVLRGYYGYNFSGDTGTHIGNLLSATLSGTVEGIYPNLYSLTLFLIDTSSLNIIYLTSILPAFFVLLFIVGVYLLSCELFPKKEMATLSAFVACALPFGVVSDYTGSLPLPCYIPYTQTLLFFTPFLLFILFRIVNTQRSRKTYLILGILLTLSSMLHHILASAVLLLFVVILCLWVIYKREHYLNVIPTVLSLITIIGSVIIVGILGAGWLNYLDRVLNSLQNIFFGSSDSTGGAYSAELSDLTGTAMQMDVPDILSVVIRQFGSTGLILLFILLALPLVYSGLKNRVEYLNVIPLYLLIVPLFGLAGISLFSSLPYQPGRMIMFVTVIGIVLSGIILYHLISLIVQNKSHFQSVTSVLFLLVLLIPLFISGLYMYYPSYEVESIGFSNTYADTKGMEFYLENGNLQYQYLGLGGQPPVYRHSDLLYGTPIYSVKEGNIINHFGYDTKDHLTDSYNSPAYLLIDTKDTMFQQACDRWQKYRHYWSEDDYKHLDYDSSVEKIMDNPDMTWYLIH